jgi:hypothetical protein
MTDPQRPHRPLPAPLIPEVADRHHQPRLPRHSPHSEQRVGEPLAFLLAVGRDPLRQRAAQRHDPGLGAARREHARRGGAEGNQPDAPGSPDPEPPEHERHALGHVRLQPLRRAERHRR